MEEDRPGSVSSDRGRLQLGVDSGPSEGYDFPIQTAENLQRKLPRRLIILFDPIGIPCVVEVGSHAQDRGNIRRDGLSHLISEPQFSCLGRPRNPIQLASGCASAAMVRADRVEIIGNSNTSHTGGSRVIPHFFSFLSPSSPTSMA